MNLQQLFLQQNPGVDLSTPQGMQQFTQWQQSNPQATQQAQSNPGGLNLQSMLATNPTGGPVASPIQPIQPSSGPAPVNANIPSNTVGGTNLNTNQGLQNAVNAADQGGNTQQLQGSQQYGQFGTTGTTNTAGTQQEQGTQIGQTSQTQQQTGQQQTTGQQATTGTAATTGLTQVLDQLGLGQLIQGQAGNAAQGANTASNFLQGVTQGNNPLLQAQTSNAVNQSLSGPGMVGAGQGAQARAAGDAAAQVGLSSQGQQISAAQALGGPTAVTTLAGAGNPYLGQQTSGTQATSGLTNTTGNTLSSQDLSSLTNSLNLSSLLNQSQTATNEAQSGSSAANSTQEAIGQVPQSQTSSGGGCYVCTAYYELNPSQSMFRSIRRAASWKLYHDKYRQCLVGYSIYGPRLALWGLRHRRFSAAVRPIARAILYQENRLALPHRFKAKAAACAWHVMFHYGSILVALLSGRKKIITKDPTVIAMLSRHNLYWRT